jgi:hypothetical protein
VSLRHQLHCEPWKCYGSHINFNYHSLYTVKLSWLYGYILFGLKRQRHEIFDLWFFHQTISSWSLIMPQNIFEYHCECVVPCYAAYLVLDHGPVLCHKAWDHGPALCRIPLDFFLYEDEYVWSRASGHSTGQWSSAMPHSAGQNCIALGKFVKLMTCAVCFKVTIYQKIFHR